MSGFRHQDFDFKVSGVQTSLSLVPTEKIMTYWNQLQMCKIHICGMAGHRNIVLSSYCSFIYVIASIVDVFSWSEFGHNLKWSLHLNNITSKANKALWFL